MTGEIRDLPDYHERDGRTTIPIDFAQGQSFFIVFRKAAKVTADSTAERNFGELCDICELGGGWEVSFDPLWGGPEKLVTFASLEDWAKRPEDGIKYYSGKATYRKSFDCPVGGNVGRIYLDLGRVRELAGVRLNGKDIGVVWCAPWRIEITSALQAGENKLELVVANQWVNRLIGDSGLEQGKRYSWTTWNPYKPDSPLLESGLLGPVLVRSLQDQFTGNDPKSGVGSSQSKL